ncbi:protein of unknown function [Burkholderia multivorans]
MLLHEACLRKFFSTIKPAAHKILINVYELKGGTAVDND